MKHWIPAFAGMTLSKSHLAARQILRDLLGSRADGVDLHLAIDALDLDAAQEARAAKNLHALGGAEGERRGPAQTGGY